MKTLVTTIALLTASITTAQAATGCINYSEQIEGQTVYLASICYKNSSKAEIRELFIKDGLQGLLDAGHEVADQEQLDAMTEAANAKDDNRNSVKEETTTAPVAPVVKEPSGYWKTETYWARTSWSRKRPKKKFTRKVWVQN